MCVDITAATLFNFLLFLVSELIALVSLEFVMLTALINSFNCFDNRFSVSFFFSFASLSTFFYATGMSKISEFFSRARRCVICFSLILFLGRVYSDILDDIYIFSNRLVTDTRQFPISFVIFRHLKLDFECVHSIFVSRFLSGRPVPIAENCYALSSAAHMSGHGNARCARQC